MQRGFFVAGKAAACSVYALMFWDGRALSFAAVGIPLKRGLSCYRPPESAGPPIPSLCARALPTRPGGNGTNGSQHIWSADRLQQERTQHQKRTRKTPKAAAKQVHGLETTSQNTRLVPPPQHFPYTGLLESSCPLAAPPRALPTTMALSHGPSLASRPQWDANGTPKRCLWVPSAGTLTCRPHGHNPFEAPRCPAGITKPAQRAEALPAPSSLQQWDTGRAA